MRFNKITSVVLKVLSLTLALVFVWRIMCVDKFDASYISMIETVPIRTNRIICGLIRVFANVGVFICIFIGFFDFRFLKRLTRYIVPIVVLVNFLFIETIMSLYLGVGVSDGPEHFYRVPQFFIENGLLLVISVLVWVSFIVNKEYKEIKINKPFFKELGFTVLIFIFFCIIIAPLSTLLAIFGPCGESGIDFSFTHRICIYSTFLIPLLLMFTLRFRSPRFKYFICLCISVACFYGFFSLYNFNTYVTIIQCFSQRRAYSDYGAIPLHLCNAGVVISLIAFVFKNKACFYFNYLINVLGAMFAIFMPNSNGDLFYSTSIHFWQNHIWIVALPLLARGLDVFPKPKLKYVLYCLSAFTVYFITVACVDTWLGYTEPGGCGVDYFFLNSDKFVSDVKGLRFLRDDFIFTFTDSGGIEHRIYWLYWIIIFVVYCLLTFGVYYIFKLLDIICDSHYDLMCKIKHKKEQLILFEKLKGKGDSKMIEIKHLVKNYGDSERNAVDDVSMTIKPGDIFGFLGHNGAGKSTLIKCLIGAQPITSGTIEIFGHNIVSEPLETKRLIGYVPDNHAVYEGLTGREYINYIANLYLVSTTDRKERLEKYAEMFHITSALDKQISSYSHGMKQKITIIAALIHEPKVWVLDEPLTGLDPTSCHQIKECMKEHAAKGNIVFFSSHVIEVVENVCNKIVVVGHGKLLCEYDLGELKKEGKSLEDIYLKYVTNVDSL